MTDREASRAASEYVRGLWANGEKLSELDGWALYLIGSPTSYWYSIRTPAGETGPAFANTEDIERYCNTEAPHHIRGVKAVLKAWLAAGGAMPPRWRTP
jgi:hypothetical protein